MQHGEEYGGGGVYSAPPIPHDHSAYYGGSPPYGSATPSAPSAPAFAQAPPSYYQPNNPSLTSYNCSQNSSFAQQEAPPSYSHPSQDPRSSLLDQASSPSSYNTSLSSSYAPVVPSYPAVGSPYDRSFDIGLGLAPPSPTPVDTGGPQQRSHYYEISNYGVASQGSGGFDPYAQGKGVSSSQGDKGYGGPVYDHGAAAYDRPGYGLSDLGHYGSSGGADVGHDNGGFSDVYAYDGGSVEPYGARGTGGNSWAGGGTGVSGGFNSSNDKSNTKITRVTPKVDADSDTGGIQKFRVKLLPESRSAESIKDVVCQIGLDGVRMVDPSTNRTLRIYPLDTITKWEVKEQSVFTFWAKSAVDVDQRVIQLKSSNHITTAILDTLTAACVQLCEIGGKDGPDGGSSSAGVDITGDASSGTVKKGSVLDWVALRPRAPTAEEKHHWVPDEAVTKCNNCESDFGPFLRRHHCRNCGDIFCDRCTRGRIALNADEDSQPVRVCDRCLAEVTHRLENMTRASSKVSAPQRTHEDLAKKLQEELERNQAGRRPISAPSSARQGSSNQTSVLNCKKCGSITLVTGSNSRCSNCGADPGSGNLVQKDAGAFRPSSGPRGPPHLWSNDAPFSDKPGPQMREVACPTCTVHLQVQVPSFGTETVECGVCQHPFLVSA